MTRTKKAARRGQHKQKQDVFRTDLLGKSDMENKRFTAYYQAQGIVPDDEWEILLNSLRTPLPTTFRIAGSRQSAHDLKTIIEESFVPVLSNVVFEDEPVLPPAPIQWYPEGLAWQFNVSKKVLRKSPEFKRFHSFLVFETDVGNISRQEAVSMIPPLLLDVQPHHHVIDMCAAPGSKTAQILEALHAQDTSGAGPMPSGLLIANDSDHKRTHLLIHQSARLPSPTLMVTNLDASIYPTIKLPVPTIVAAGRGNQNAGLSFDRILCDVPCSGDGTLRKNVGIWKSWQPGDGNGLHSLQLRILQRAMKMLKDGGRIVYSTCSLNPVENEAVIAAALNSDPAYELVDVSTQLPELIRRPGLTSWRPTNAKAATKTYQTFEQYIATLSDTQKSESKMTEGHWPPPNVQQLHLEHCMRIYPHLQNTGGFFVAVLQKVEQKTISRDHMKREADSLLLLEPKKRRLDDGDGIVEDDVVHHQSQQGADDHIMKAESLQEHPYTYLAPDNPILCSCMEKLKLTSDFPAHNVLIRNPVGEPVRSLYLTNDMVKSVILHNDYNRIRLISCGTKVFVKQEGKSGLESQFRILGEGLPVVMPFVRQDSVLEGGTGTLKTLLQTLYPLTNTFEEPFKQIIENKDPGCHVVRFAIGALGKTRVSHDILLPLWKSSLSVSLMINKKAKSALSMRIFAEDITTSWRDRDNASTSLNVLEPGEGNEVEDMVDSHGNEHPDEDGA